MEVAAVGMLDRLEQRLDRLINGGFARAFKAELVPAEIAAAIRRECDETASTAGRRRPVAANDYVVHMAADDHARLAGEAAALCARLADDVRAHTVTQNYMLVGPLTVRFEPAADLPVGVCRVRGLAVPAAGAPPREQRPPASPWLDIAGARTPLRGPVTVLGRDARADVRLGDPGVSGRHAVIRLGAAATIEDLGSTNGTMVDGARIGRAELRDRSVIIVGETRIVFHWM
jgi:hypothetical protein